MIMKVRQKRCNTAIIKLYNALRKITLNKNVFITLNGPEKKVIMFLAFHTLMFSNTGSEILGLMPEWDFSLLTNPDMVVS